MYIKTICNGESDVHLKAVGAQIRCSVLPDSVKRKVKQIHLLRLTTKTRYYKR